MPQPSSLEKKQEWINRIVQQQQSGLSIEKWCKQNQVSPHVFHYWKEKLFPKPLQRTSFAELNSKQQNHSLSLQYPGLFVRLGADCNPVVRKQIFALFMDLPC